jgi:hypothetical protein
MSSLLVGVLLVPMLGGAVTTERARDCTHIII